MTYKEEKELLLTAIGDEIVALRKAHPYGPSYPARGWRLCPRGLREYLDLEEEISEEDLSDDIGSSDCYVLERRELWKKGVGRSVTTSLLLFTAIEHQITSLKRVRDCAPEWRDEQEWAAIRIQEYNVILSKLMDVIWGGRVAAAHRPGSEEQYASKAPGRTDTAMNYIVRIANFCELSVGDEVWFEESWRVLSAEDIGTDGLYTRRDFAAEQVLMKVSEVPAGSVLEPPRGDQAVGREVEVARKLADTTQRIAK